MAAYGSWFVDALDDYFTGLTIKAMLVDDTHVPNIAATTPPTGDEISGTGYTAGGIDVTSLIDSAYAGGDSVSLTLTALANFGPIVATNIGGIVFYVSGGKPLVVDMFGSVDWDGGTDGDFTYAPAITGFMSLLVGT